MLVLSKVSYITWIISSAWFQATMNQKKGSHEIWKVEVKLRYLLRLEETNKSNRQTKMSLVGTRCHCSPALHSVHFLNCLPWWSILVLSPPPGTWFQAHKCGNFHRDRNFFRVEVSMEDLWVKFTKSAWLLKFPKVSSCLPELTLLIGNS